jgi:hypothetical protein
MYTLFGTGPPRPEGRAAPLESGHRPQPKRAAPSENGRRASNRAGYGTAPAHSQASPQANAIARLRRQRQVEAIHELGPRVLHELLDELDRHHRLGQDLDRRLERFAVIDLAILRAVGGDRFPARPLREVP